MCARLKSTLTLLALLGLMPTAFGQPKLTNSAVGTLELVANGPSSLVRVDGLAFDVFGNLFAALERTDGGGGVVYVDKTNGSVSAVLASISGSDQVKWHPSGKLYVSSELDPEDGGGIYSVNVTSSAGIPSLSSPAYLLTLPAVIDNPEGLVVLPTNSAFGTAGDLVVGEDLTNGRVIMIALATGATTILIPGTAGLQRPEGLVYGDFSGQANGALYLAETLANRVLRIDSNGDFVPFGNSAAVGLTLPDNLAFGPDGLLYVTEDLSGASSGRIMRIGPDGNYSTFAEGFKKPAGLAFDPFSGDLYIAEQDQGKIWRVQFAAPVPEPRTWALMGVGGVLIALAVRRRHLKRRALV